MQYNLTLICPTKRYSNKTANINLKNYQFETHGEGDIDSTKIANVILRGQELIQPTFLHLNLNTNVLVLP